MLSYNPFRQPMVSLRQTSQRQAFCDAWEALKFVFSQGSAPHPAGELDYDAPPDLLVSLGGETPFPNP